VLGIELKVTLELPPAPTVEVAIDSYIPRGAVGLAELLAADVAEPVELVAVTVKVYEVPFVKPVTVIGLEAPVPVIEPGFEVAV
jgi:hypothetical protein